MRLLMAPGSRYRWLTVGERAVYVGRQGRRELRGRKGRVVAVPAYVPKDAPKNVAVLLEGDRAAMIAPAGCWRPCG